MNPDGFASLLRQLSPRRGRNQTARTLSDGFRSTSCVSKNDQDVSEIGIELHVVPQRMDLATLTG